MELLRQLVATDGNGFGVIPPFSRLRDLPRLPPVATTGLHRGSIFRWQSWRHAEVFTLGACLERARKRVASKS
jgi:hypothetical protein